MWYGLATDVITGIGAVTSVAALVAQARAHVPAKQRQRMVAVLREFYFTPDGVVSLLDAVAEGYKLDPVETQRVLTSFNDAQWRIESRLTEIELADWNKSFAFDMDTARALQEIAWSKNRIRYGIQEVLNRATMRFNENDRHSAAQYRDELLKLNAAIIEMDRQLLA